MLSEAASFVAVCAAVIVTPGQDTALTVRITLTAGRRSGFATAAGVASGQACWSVAAAAGLTAVLLASDAAFTTIKVLGAAYLILLGAHALREATRRDRCLVPVAPTGHSGPDVAGAYRQGLLSNLANPKMAAFFGSLLPQFVAGSHSTFVPSLALGGAFCGMTLAWLSLYAIALTRLRSLLERPAARRWLDAVTGTALVAFGVKLAVARAPGQ